MRTAYNQYLLVAEDSDEDFAVFQRFIRRLEVQTPIHRCIDGDEVLDFLYKEGAYQNSARTAQPSVILLDLNLPGLDGRELLKKLKQDETLKKIPIVVFTTSSNPDDVELCYRSGANGYLIKPVGASELQKTVQAFADFWLTTNTPPHLRIA